MAVDLRKGAKARFWSKVDKKGPDDCWLWLGATDKDGYGIFRPSASVCSARAHRVSLQLAQGSLSDDIQVLHECDTPACVNPLHLFEGTHLTNMRDKVAKGRQVSGLQVHPDLALRGEEHPLTTLTEEQVRSIRTRYVPRKVPLRVFATQYGVSESTISNVVRGVTWGHI
jgi:hypothetical protein